MKNLWLTGKHLISIFFLVLGCVGCSMPDHPVATHVDPFTGMRTDVMADNMLAVEEPVRELVWLNASRVYRDYLNHDYFFEVHFEATEERGFLEITPGPSLIFTVDGEKLQFRTTGSQNSRRTEDELVSEDALYPTTKEAIQKIASADSVRVQIQGLNGLIQRDFTPDNFARFQAFYKQYILNSQ